LALHHRFLDALFMRDVLTGLIKSFMFGVNHHRRRLPGRLEHPGGAEQVGRSTLAPWSMSIFL